MGSLKRKDGPGGSSSSNKPPKSTASSDLRPSKRAKSDKAAASRGGSDQQESGFKDGKTSKNSTAPVPLVSRLKEEEPMFPRGGASVLSPLEQKQIQIQAKRDVLFEQESGAAGKGGGDAKELHKKKRKFLSKSDAPRDKVKVWDEDAVKVESLNYKRLKPASLVLGQVCEITPLEIGLALPNNLVGHIPITAVSEAFTARLEASAAQDETAEDGGEDGVGAGADTDLRSLFELSQYLRAYVVTTTTEDAAPVGKGRHHIGLSVQPEHANSGLSEQDVVENVAVMASVASVEDHGFVMDLGIADSSIRGFLPRKQLDPSTPEERMQPGSVMLCIVTGKGAGGKIAQLSTARERMGSAKHVPSAATTINSFLPGTAVDVLVSEVSSRGLVGKVMGHLDVTADLVHSGAGPGGIDLEEKYKVGSHLKARVICTFPDAKNPKVGISLLPHVIAMQPKTTTVDGQEKLPLAVLRHSAIVEQCTVKRVEPDIGLYVDVGVDNVPAFVHISRVKDGKVDALFENSGPFKLDSVHRGRVVGYNAFDGLFFLSFEKNVLEQAFLRIEDIPVGEVVSGVIGKLIVGEEGVSGIIVQLAEGISGLVPEMHFADVHLQHPEKKFRPGLKVKARVLSTDLVKRQIRLTLKKTLVNSEAVPISSFDEAAVGMQVPGSLINILPTGAIVQFYGRLRGFLPVSEMSEAYISDPKEHFRIGQVVSVHVKNCDPEARRLIVSCKDPGAFGMEKQLALKSLNVGDLVSAKVTQKTEDDVYVELADSGLKAVLAVGHLTDKSASKTQSALKKIHVGQTLSDLVVLEKNENRRSIKLSQKPSLVKASKEGKLLTSFDAAKVGRMVQGFVRGMTPTAAFVQFAGNLSALLPKSRMPREFQEKEDFGLHKFQPLLVRIHSVDTEHRRLVVAVPSAADEEDKTAVKSGEQAVNPLDDSIVSVHDIASGQLTKARVVSVRETQLNVQLADNIQGRIDVSEIFDSWDEIVDPRSPLMRFQPKQIVRVRVLGIHDARNHRFLPISHRSSHSVLELSMKPSDVQADVLPEQLTLEKLTVGSTYLGFVNNVAKNCLWVNLSPSVRGRISAMEVSDDLTLARDLEESFPIGSALRVRVVAVDSEKNRLDLSARSSSAAELTWDTVEQNMVLPGRVTKVNDRQVLVKLGETLAGPIHMADLADDYDEADPHKYSKNEIVRVAVVELDKNNKRIRLSTRPSRIMSSGLPVKDKEITKASNIRVGDLLRGFVKNVSDKGLFVNLGGDVTAHVKIRDTSDQFVKEWKDGFQIDQLVKGRVISVMDGRTSMSLKPSVADKDWAPPITIADLKEGQDVTGKVRKVEDFGAFIEIDGSANVSGLCHRSQMAENPVEDARKLYSAGDVVKARVLRVDVAKKRVNLGLKPSYFEKDGDDKMDLDKDDEDGGAELDAADDQEEDEGEEEDEDEDEDEGDDGILEPEEEEGDDDDDDDDDDDEGDFSTMAPSKGLSSGLNAGGFDWSAGALDADGDFDMDGTSGATNPVKKASKRREPQIEIDKTGELDAHGPQTASDYERLLLGQPDSSRLWIQYMALQMQVSDVAKAREIAERAIKSINIREEREKVNIWVAYLNLEVAYGTEESVQEVFKRACTYNDEQEIHERLASIYIQSRKLKEAEDLFEAMAKKFGSTSPSVWTNYADFLHVTASAPDRARGLLKRATQVLGGGSSSSRDAATAHVYLPLVAKFAALEYHSPHGDHEQGRTLFENLLATYPKRFDMWSMLLDLETSAFAKARGEQQAVTGGAGDPAAVRDVFDRCTRVKGLKPRQARGWFKRWAEWEEQYGDAKSRERVSARAQEWARAAEARKKAAAAGADGADEGED